MGDVLLVILPALILAAVLWAFATALNPRDVGRSDAERYQQELAVRSQAHYAAQVQAATAARARVDAVTRPSQNEQQQTQQADHARRRAARISGARAPRRPTEPAVRPAAPIDGKERQEASGHQAAAPDDPFRSFDRQEICRSAVVSWNPCLSPC